MAFDVELADPAHLSRCWRSLKHLDGVFDAYRQLPGKKAMSPAIDATRAGAAARPTGTHDVLWPESARWEALRRDLRPRWPSGPATGSSRPRCSRTSAVFRRGIGEESEVVSKEMYEFADRGRDACSRCGPRARPRWCGPSSSTTRYCPGRPGTSTPAFRYERPQAGRYRQHHQVGVEVLGSADPDRRRGGDLALADALLRVARAGRLPPARQLDGRRAVPAGVRGPARRATCGARRDELCDEHRGPHRGQPAAGARLQDARRAGR